MDENEIAAKFSEMVEIEKLISHPTYQRLMDQLDLAALNLFNFMATQGHGDIGTVHSKIQCLCGCGKFLEFMQYTCKLIKNDGKEEHYGPAQGDSGRGH